MAKTAHKYSPGDKVYLVDDSEQQKRTVINVVITPLGVSYTIRIDGAEVDVYEIELSEDKNVI